MITVKVNVTQGDIDNGVKGDDKRCPVALAVERTIGANWVAVTSDYIKYSWGYKNLIPIATPDVVRNFIDDFDLLPSHWCKPFSFELELICPS